MGFSISSYDEYQNHVKRGSLDWVDNTNHGKCVGCGECCSNILPLTEKEIKEIKEYIKQNNIKEDKILYPTRTVLIDMTCPFLIKNKTTNKRCKIYKVRPKICRYFKCNEPYGALDHMDMYEERRKKINVRETFFNE